MLLPFRFYQVRDGQGWGLGDKDMESERVGCGSRIKPSFFNWTTVSTVFYVQFDHSSQIE